MWHQYGHVPHSAVSDNHWSVLRTAAFIWKQNMVLHIQALVICPECGFTRSCSSRPAIQKTCLFNVHVLPIMPCAVIYCNTITDAGSSRPRARNDLYNICAFTVSLKPTLSLLFSRKSLRNMIVTSWRRGAVCSPYCHLGPPPRSSTSPRQCLRTWSLRICPRIDPPCHVSLSPRVHRADRGRHRGPNPRRNLEWDFDSLMCVCPSHTQFQLELRLCW